MASLHRHAAVLSILGLLAGCGGDRSRAGAGADTTGAAAATPDSTAMPAADTAHRDTAPPPARAAPDTARHLADTAATRAPVAKAPATKKPASTAVAPAPAPTPAPAPAPTPAPTAAAPQQDTTSAPAEAPLRDAYHQAPHDTVSQAVYDGWKQFNLNCARCHGEDVLGTTIAPHLILSLKPDGPINTKELFVQTVCAGRPAKGMPAWCALGLGLDKINDIYLYVKGRSDAKISPGRPAVKKEG
jgi:cbb3-type cytochrome c oxidase subunit III